MHNLVLARKVGMTQVYGSDGVIQPVTVLEIGGCVVDLVRTVERDGYDAVRMVLGARGAAACRESRIDRSVRQYSVGEILDLPFVVAGGKVDVVGTSKGRGTAGVMKRHNFAGQRASHGVKKVHRHPGSTGMSSDPSKVIKGTKMSGRYGNSQVTVRNLKVVAIDSDAGMLALNGAVPGYNGSILVVRQAVEP